MKLTFFITFLLASTYVFGAVEKQCDVFVEGKSPETELTICRTDFETEKNVLISKGCFSESCYAYLAYLKAPKTRLDIDEKLPDVDGGAEMCEVLKGKRVYVGRKPLRTRANILLCKFDDSSYIGVAYLNPFFSL